jgi:hypothetical protein
MFSGYVDSYHRDLAYITSSQSAIIAGWMLQNERNTSTLVGLFLPSLATIFCHLEVFRSMVGDWMTGTLSSGAIWYMKLMKDAHDPPVCFIPVPLSLVGLGDDILWVRRQSCV